MKQRALAALALIMAACAHDERPATPSASSVERANDVPSNNPDFTPPENRAVDATDAGVQTVTGTNGTSSGSSNTTGSDANGASSTTGTASNGSSSTTGSTAPRSSNTTNSGTNTGPSGSAAPRADNSDVNDRDRSRSAVTPMDQGESEADRTITQQIRQAVMKDGSLSFNAKNVKIITLNRKVTLRGPVKSAAERTAIEAAAKKVAGVTSVENQLEIAE